MMTNFEFILKAKKNSPHLFDIEKGEENVCYSHAQIDPINVTETLSHHSLLIS